MVTIIMKRKTWIIGLLDRLYAETAWSRDKAILKAFKKHYGNIGTIFTVRESGQNDDEEYIVDSMQFMKKHNLLASD